MKTSPNKRIPQGSDWVQVDIEGNSVNINLNLAEEVTFYPEIGGEPTLSIQYTSGRNREFRGKRAQVLWNLMNQQISFECAKSC